MAKTNFVIAHQGALKEEEDIKENRLAEVIEVEDWLMGSGESGDTTGSSSDQNKMFQKLQEKKPTKPLPGEEWMFKTFDPFNDGPTNNPG